MARGYQRLQAGVRNLIASGVADVSPARDRVAHEVAGGNQTDEPLSEVLPGILHWSGPHPNHGAVVHSHFLTEQRVADRPDRGRRARPRARAGGRRRAGAAHQPPPPARLRGAGGGVRRVAALPARRACTSSRAPRPGRDRLRVGRGARPRRHLSRRRLAVARRRRPPHRGRPRRPRLRRRRRRRRAGPRLRPRLADGRPGRHQGRDPRLDPRPARARVRRPAAGARRAGPGRRPPGPGFVRGVAADRRSSAENGRDHRTVPGLS